MLSYKEYKQLNESLYGAFNLGIKQNNILTPPIGATGESEILDSDTEASDDQLDLEESKKVCKCGKMMKKGMDCECSKDKDHDDDKDDDKDDDGLTAGQKKLPKALQDAILKKKKSKSKKEWSEVMSDVESLIEDVSNQKIKEEVYEIMNKIKNEINKSPISQEEKNWWESVNSQLYGQ